MQHTILTDRQQQILKLLSAGASNKEIADKLSISLGTVKQHLNTLYKRLNVRNRAMAVSQLQNKQAETSQTHAGYIRRPCAVVSFEIAEHANESSIRQLQVTLAGLAFDYQAIFLSRGKFGGALVFGIKNHSEGLMKTPLQAISLVCGALQGADKSCVTLLKVAVSAGMAVVRHHDFATEKLDHFVASSIVQECHSMLSGARQGFACFDDRAIGLMQADGLGLKSKNLAEVELSVVQSLFIRPLAVPALVNQRQDDLRQLQEALHSQENGIVLLQAENGLGKSLLLSHLVKAIGQQKKVVWLGVLRDKPEAMLVDLLDGVFYPLSALQKMIKQIQPQHVIVDDAHFLSKNNLESLLRATETTKPVARIFAGRSIKLDQSAVIVKLSKLNDASLNELLIQELGNEENRKLDEIKKLSSGVPLFARELAAQDGEHIPLSLLVVIAQRLAAFHVDWEILYVLAVASQALQLDRMATALHESLQSVEQRVSEAQSFGILQVINSRDDRWVSFRHPLVRKAVEILCLEWDSVLQKVSR
jgi:DNA-binding CsgD family transcriptional regulator/DNA-binding transcriptional ArsR family regulator